ncbi:MAG: glutamate synthase [Christensenella sp.]|nr:glutamate synthase [Christensenella sp.]
MNINAGKMHFKDLNQQIKAAEDKTVVVDHCIGQRYIGSGLADKKIVINGTPGNALGAYLDGSEIRVNGNAQDATGDTMNDGAIYIAGSSGDATGYAMRGGKIFVNGDVGYRAGIHMKEYREKSPVLVIGGCAGSFLGEYQAGGTIIVLGIDRQRPVGNFCGTGMHGGRIYLRCDELPPDLPPQIVANRANQDDMGAIRAYIEEFCEAFGRKKDAVTNANFFVLRPDSKNPYKQLYTQN